MVDISIRNLVKKFGSTTAANNINMDIEKGQMVALLGPSGCGKTTLLRMIAGFEQPTSGDIILKGKRVNDIPPQKRNVGIVFQDYAVFPTMTVFDNVAYGLKIKKIPKEQIFNEVMYYLSLVGLIGLEKRMPNQLSGGQQQRVALARALINKPDVLLLDEPLSNLDAALRLKIRKEIRKIQKQLSITAVFVTHDQEEAMSIADQVFVMRNGFVMQGGTPYEIYTKPENDFVANFIGRSNILYGKVLSADSNSILIDTKGLKIRISRDTEKFSLGQDVWISIRPQYLRIRNGASEATGANSFAAKITYLEYLGTFTKGEVRLADGIELEFEFYHVDGASGVAKFAVGDDVIVEIDPASVIAGSTLKGL